jgi:hypothetical protein
MMAKALLRPSVLYGRGGRLGVGRTKFFEDYVLKPGRDKPGACIPGTSVPRLRLVQIGERALAAIEDEVDELIDALRAARDKAHHPKPRKSTTQHAEQRR